VKLVNDFYLTSQWSKKELCICSDDSFISYSFSSSSLTPPSSSDGDEDDGKSETSVEDSYF
jgi:hypothetical protein